MKGRTRAAVLFGLGTFFAARAGLRQLSAYDFRGKVALVTGGSRGLGLAVARELSGRGARVAICARNHEELERARASAGVGGELLAVTCDVGDRAAVEDMVRLVRERLGPVDVLVNNAGIIQVGPFEEMTEEDFQQSMRTHFWGPLYATWAVLPQMRERRSGRIVNISSVGGKLSVPHLSPYCASKFALAGLSEGLRAELARDGIQVTTVCPGLLRTGSPRNAHFKGQHRTEYALFILSDSLPLLTMSADRAARRIVGALRVGQAELVLTPAAKLGVKAWGLFSGLMQDLFAAVGRLLPGPGGVGKELVEGKRSESRFSRSALTYLTRRAELALNQLE